MKTASALLACCIALTASSLSAQQVEPPSAPAKPIAPQPAQSMPAADITMFRSESKPITAQPAPSIADHLVNKVTFAEGLPLSDAIQMLESQCPEFQAVIVHDPRNPDFSPSLPAISLKNLPLSQIITVIGSSTPGLMMDKVSSPKGDVWVFRIRRTDTEMNRRFGGGGLGRSGPTEPAPPTVQIFRLSPLIRANTVDRSKALNDILSLVQAALDAAGSPGSMMKLHAPTETLIFSGNQLQLEAVAAALKALEPTPGEVNHSNQEQAAKDSARMMEMEMSRLKEVLTEAKNETAESRNRVNQLTDEIEKLRAHLRTLEPVVPSAGPR